MDPPETMRASATPPAPTITTAITATQIQNRLLFRAATAHLLRPSPQHSIFRMENAYS
jgi:hypothetical protein